MKEYLLLFRGGDMERAGRSPEVMQEHMQKWALWMSGLQEQGKLIGAQPLASEGKVVSGSRKVVTDGPFMEGKEMLGGYLACRAASYEEAVEISKGCPVLDDEGFVEVREIKQM